MKILNCVTGNNVAAIKHQYSKSHKGISLWPNNKGSNKSKKTLRHAIVTLDLKGKKPNEGWKAKKHLMRIYVDTHFNFLTYILIQEKNPFVSRMCSHVRP